MIGPLRTEDLDNFTRFLVRKYTQALNREYGFSHNLENFIENNAQIQLREKLRNHFFKSRFKSKNIKYFTSLLPKLSTETDIEDIELTMEDIDKRLEILNSLKKKLEIKKEKIFEKNKKKNFKAKIRKGIPNFDPGAREDYLHRILLERQNKYRVNVYSKGSDRKIIGEYYQDTKNFDFKKIKNSTRKNIFEKSVKKIYLMSEVNETRYQHKDYNNEKFDKINMEIHIICHSHQDLGWYSTYNETLERKKFN